MNFDNVACTECSAPKVEPAMSILEEMDAILRELGKELGEINDAVYSLSNADSMRVVDGTQGACCLLGTLTRQRTVAKSLLDTARHIREGLW